MRTNRSWEDVPGDGAPDRSVLQARSHVNSVGLGDVECSTLGLTKLYRDTSIPSRQTVASMQHCRRGEFLFSERICQECLALSSAYSLLWVVEEFLFTPGVSEFETTDFLAEKLFDGLLFSGMFSSTLSLLSDETTMSPSFGTLLFLLEICKHWIVIAEASSFRDLFTLLSI